MSKKEEPRILNHFYSFYVLAAAFAILFFTSGARYSFGVMFKPIIAEFGWDRASISLAFFLNMTLYALSVSVVGRFYDRYGPKWVIVISTVFVSVGYMLISVIDSFWQFLILYGIIAAVGLGGPSVTLMAAVTSKWFEKWRGAAISFALSGNSMGQFVLIPLFTLFVSRFGWRASYFSIGLIMLFVNVGVALFVLKGDPDALGRKPFGHDPEGMAKGRMTGPLQDQRFRDLNLKEAMGVRSFWVFLITMFICGSGDFLVTAHLIPMVTDHGISPVTAGNMLAWLGLMSLAGILVAGPVSDMIGNKTPIALTFVLRCILFLLIVKHQSVGHFYAFSLGFGFTLLITAPLSATLMGRLFGFAHVGLITGFITTIHHLGGGFWAYVGGLTFDRTGSYRLVFTLSAAMALIAVFTTLLIAEKRHQVSIPQ